MQTIEEIKKGKTGSLKIGCTTAIAEGWLPDILFNYRKQNPDIETHCIVFDSLELLYRSINSNQVNFGISDISFERVSDITATSIDTIHYSAFIASHHPLAKQSWLSLKELTTVPWVVLPSGAPSRLVFESRLEELGLSEAFSQLETVDTLSLMRTYIHQGYLGFASEFEFKSDCQAGTLTAISLQEFALSGNVYLLLSKQLHASPRPNPAQKFIALVQKVSLDDAPTVRLRSPSFLLRDSIPHKPETLTLSIGVQNRTIPAIAAGLIMQRLGLLEHFLPTDGQYQIQWSDFTTGAPIVEGLHSGQLDIGVLGDYPLLLSAVQPDRNAHKTRLVSFVSANPDGSCNALVVPQRSHLESIEDLRGRVIAVPFNSSAHSMVIRSLHATNLLGNVQLAALEHPNSAKAFEFPPQLADSYAHFAPFHDVACRQGTFRYLPNSHLEQLPVFYGVVVRAALAERYPEVVIGYLRALMAAQQWYDRTPAALTLVSQWTRIETEIIAQTLTSSYQKNQPGRFFSEMTIRSDWLSLHLDQLHRIPGNESLESIDWNSWIQPEFLQRVHL